MEPHVFEIRIRTVLGLANQCQIRGQGRRKWLLRREQSRSTRQLTLSINAGWRLKIIQNSSPRSNVSENWTRTILSHCSLLAESNMRRRLRSCSVSLGDGWPGERCPTVMRTITLPLESFPSHPFPNKARV